MAYLDNVLSPEDIKKMPLSALETLAEEMRRAILKRCSIAGGHVGSNLGMVEATIALHYVFSSPIDKIVFDVSHQCYAHKLLTGRKDGFLNPEEYGHITGFTNPKESEHDLFMVGHTSTSLSLASGLAKARDLLNEKHNVIAVIGDGSLSGGEAMEGLSFAASELKSNFIVVVNDNGMSMVENHGGIYENLNLLKQSKGKAELNLFKALGYDYLYVDEGNNIHALIEAFRQVKDCTKPVVVHLNTLKGKGYQPAESNQEMWHKHSPFELTTGQSPLKANIQNYNDLTRDYFMKCLDEGLPLAVVVAATPNAFGFSTDIRQKFGAHYIDVGIAEEHATSMVSALAKGGCKPVFCVQSSFVQRAYDQLLQDLALNKSPALILIYNSGLSDTDATHLGCFDMAMITNIPDILYLSPATAEEYMTMLDWAIKQNDYPVAMRVPSGVPVFGNGVTNDQLEIHRAQVIEKGSEIAIVCDGHCLAKGQKVVSELKKYGYQPTLVNARFLDAPDEKLLTELENNHQLVVTLEDGIISGGFGEKVATFYGPKAMNVLCFGAKKEFTNRVALNEIYQQNRLNESQITEDILALMNEGKPLKLVK